MKVSAEEDRPEALTSGLWVSDVFLIDINPIVGLPAAL